MKRFKRGFTLAEVLITLAIIGVVAAIAIPSVISNSQQQEFKTGLRKAVSVLNSAITMNMAIDGESPYENTDLYYYLQRHMNVMKSTLRLPYYYRFKVNGTNTVRNSNTNCAFYTTDGMRFEMDDNDSDVYGPKLHESDQQICLVTTSLAGPNHPHSCMGCGSYGLAHNPNGTTKPPCLLLVDVNGDRKPSPGNVNCNDAECGANNFYVYPNPSQKTVTDIFGIMITEDRAVPFGVVAQRAMYQAQK